MTKCCPCLDKAIESSATPDMSEVNDAVTSAPLLQMFQAGGQQIAGVAVIPVCLECRARQLGKSSKTGLVVA